MRPALQGLLIAFTAATFAAADEPRPIRVLVWDEQQPAQKRAYPDYLGNAISRSLRDKPGLVVATARLDDPEQGLGNDRLDRTDVLVWWGHVRHREIKPDTGRSIVQRIKTGKLSLIALHSAHWSTPFVEAMYERSRIDALAALPELDRARARIVESPTHLFAQPRRHEPLSPRSVVERSTDGAVTVRLALPNCCFPAYRGDGKPSHVRVLLPGHSIARGLPATFDIPQTEMYDEPFHVPTPDLALFEETWDAGERFRSGSIWSIGQGKVLYFRPGHETYPVFLQPEVQLLLANAVRWLGEELPR